MHIRCPHCHNAIEIVEDSSFGDVDRQLSAEHDAAATRHSASRRKGAGHLSSSFTTPRPPAGRCSRTSFTNGSFFHPRASVIRDQRRSRAPGPACLTPVPLAPPANTPTHQAPPVQDLVCCVRQVQPSRELATGCCQVIRNQSEGGVQFVAEQVEINGVRRSSGVGVGRACHSRDRTTRFCHASPPAHDFVHTT